MRSARILSVILAGTAALSALGGCGLAGQRSQPFGIATTSMAVCQILDRLNIDDVVGIPSAAEDIDLPERYKDVRTIGSAMTPDMEILSQVNPEVVIVPRTLEAGLSAQFESAGIGATTGPWYQCVMKNSANKEMAQQYVEYMYDHNADYMDLTLKIAGRTSVYEEAGQEAGNEHTTAVLETLEAAQSQPRPMVSTWPQIDETLIGVVESCLGGADVNETLEAAQAEIEAIGK